MMWYSIGPRNWIIAKGNGFLSFAKSMIKNVGKNISKNLSFQYSQKLLDNAKHSATNSLKTAWAIQKAGKN